ncbi:MAG: sulfite exporter TauE/SafE family protein [Candidatus Colwellbacteria bacterium]|nr:sulfite exporter TauE/SafE family protein [Candidatus Colwellbacteria bacterium]
MKTHTFYVIGMHCKACVTLTENELREIPNIFNVKVSLRRRSVEIIGDFGDKTTENIAQELSEVLRPHGYALSLVKQRRPVKWSEFTAAIPIALAFIALFIALQEFGIVNLVTISNVTYGTAFIVGLIASVSTCMAVVGGLVLSISASFAKGDNKTKPQILFHIGRLVSFLILGGIIGILGSAFQLNTMGIFILSLSVAIILLLLGINLLDIFPWAEKLQPALPSSLGRYVQGLKNINHIFTPLLVGAATFFMPCGFTQSMQIYTLTTGSFWTGALTMFFFALGTLPVLALLSFGSLAIRDKTKMGIFLKTAGLIVIFFGVFNLINSLVVAGIMSPILNF